MKRLFLFLVLLNTRCCTSNQTDQRDCSPSSCGNILNISYPFLLESDPPGCGRYISELSCENNSLLFEGIFYVKAINYHNHTIRVVDTGIDEDNCSSMPRYPLSYYNLSVYSGVLDYFQIWPREVVKPVEVIKCVEPVNSTKYLDASSCIQGLDTDSGVAYRYAYVGLMNGFDLKEGCKIEAKTLLQSFEDNGLVSSFVEIHRRMAFGFELFYMDYYCSITCSSGWCHPGSAVCAPRTQRSIDGRTFRSIIKGVADELVAAFLGLCRNIYSFCGTSFSAKKLLENIREDISSYLRVGDYWVFHAVAFLVMYATARSFCGTPFVFAFLIYKWRRRHLSMYNTIEEFLQVQNNLMPIRYAYSDIKKMTRNFSEMLGKGGFGFVYKGKLRSGQFAAIKMLEKSKANGQDFINEVATIGRIHHANVVRLIGFCSEGSKHALVYEFMSNGSLDSHIFSLEKSLSLSWEKLHEISLGVARGIEYLHRGCDIQILHFDIKPHNILLDETFTPKISDFGLAKLYPKHDTIASLTAARGTIGYMAPELFYKNIGRVSYKADVYSFGMLLLEMAGKRKNLKAPAADAIEENLSQIYYPFWVYDKLSDGKLEIEDARDEENKIVRKMIITGLWCIQMQPSTRPPMNKVVEMLEGDLEGLQLPPRPLIYPEASMQIDGEQSLVEFSESSSLIEIPT